MAHWKLYKGETALSCTHCGMGAPFARYRRKNGLNAREITNYCPFCGSKMTGIDECKDCPHSKNGEWQENGICFACRGDTWILGKKQNKRLFEQES